MMVDDDDNPMIEITLGPGRKRVMRKSQYDRIVAHERQRQAGRSKTMPMPEIQRVRQKFMMALREPVEVVSRAQHKELMDKHNLVELEPPDAKRPRSYEMPANEQYQRKKKRQEQIGKALQQVKETSNKGWDFWKPTNETQLSDDPRLNTSGVTEVMFGEDSKSIRETGTLTLQQREKIKPVVKVR